MIPELGETLVCFGTIRRDALTMGLVINELPGVSGVVGRIIAQCTSDPKRVLDTLEHMMCTAPTKKDSSACGPMLWVSGRMERYVGSDA